MRKRIILFTLVAIMCMSLLPMNVYADDAAFRSALQQFLSSRSMSVTDESVYKWSTVISTMKADGLSNNAIAGAMGCWLYEAGDAIYAVEGYGRIKTTDGKYFTEFASGGTYDYGRSTYPPYSAYTDKSTGTSRVGSGGNGLGLAQWTWGREDTLTAFCSSLPSGIGYITVSHNEFREEKPRWVGTTKYDSSQGKYVVDQVTSVYWVYKTHKIPDFPGQILFMLHELHGAYQTSYKIIDKLNSASSPTEACKYFFTYYEGGGSDYTASGFVNRKNAAEKAIPCIEACTGVSGSAPAGTDPSASPWGTTEGFNALGADMVSKGYWSEAQLGTYCSLTEANLEDTLLQIASKSNLGQHDLEGLTDWERNHAGNLKENGYIAILRWIVVLVGILITIWALLVYLAFWFDHINSFFYLDALHLVTFGQLHICPPGDKPTFSIKEKVKTKTVSHQQILGICITAILFGSMLVSGIFYIAVAKVVNFIRRFI